MAKNCNALGIPVGHMIQAVSDGELNMSARGCGGSSSSLPGTPGGEGGPAGVLSWAVSFEKLLEDPYGVSYFTAFLKSEVSEENILFWQACEKFRMIPATSLKELKTAARFIYNKYLSESAPYSVNIDDTAKTEEKDLEQPTPEMFNKAQAQIFKLMKMDSYRRFVRSPLYQNCTLASVEGKLLPQLSLEPVRMGSLEDMANRSPSLSDKKNKNSLQSGKSASEKQRQKRGSWGESHMPVKSTSSVELGTLYRQIEVSAFVHRICTGQWEKLHFKIHEEYAHMNNKDCRQGSIEIICQKVSITLENYFQLFSPFLSSPSLILEWPIESPLLRCERWSWESVRGLLLCLLT